MNIKRKLLLILPILMFSACSIKQEVKPVKIMDNKKICIIEDKAVREGFLETYRKVLTEKDFSVKLLDKDAALDSCKLVSTYMGKWSWDLAIYLSYAEIKVYEDGKIIGSVLYDSTSGGGNIFKKFVNGENKITELVNQLFLSN